MTSSTTVFIVRHGERMDRLMKFWRDPRARSDPPLSPKGHEQALQTGQYLAQQIDRNARVILYTSPFQRCVETAAGIAHGLVQEPILKLDLGLGEWQSDHVNPEDEAGPDDIVVRQEADMLSFQHEQLARQQAAAFAAKRRPPFQVDYAYRSHTSQLIYPEDYTQVVDRFENVGKRALKEQDPGTVLIFCTHAVGVNMLLDTFRGQLTRPVETGYCCVASVQKKGEDAQWTVHQQPSIAHLAQSSPSMPPAALGNLAPLCGS